MVDKVNSLFGYPASWTPTDGSPTQTATILFKDPTSQQDLSGVMEFTPLTILMEFKASDFLGLRDMANDGNIQTIIIEEESGTNSYLTRQVNAKYDGKTMVAVLEKPDPYIPNPYTP